MEIEAVPLTWLGNNHIRSRINRWMDNNCLILLSKFDLLFLSVAGATES